MKKLIAILLILLSLNGLAQDSDERKTKQVGANLGFTTGLGVSYRIWPAKAGIQLTFLPIKYDNTEFYSIGLTGLYTLNRRKYIENFLYLGNHLVVENDNMEYNIGFGPGFSFGNEISFNIQLGYAIYDALNTFNLFPTIEVGLYFKH